MKILLVEPDVRRRQNKSVFYNGKIKDYNLRYPPLGLLKLSSFHKQYGDDVYFVRGCDNKIININLFNNSRWDRVYISSVFTFQYNTIIKTIDFYKKLNNQNIYVGGIMASIIPEDLQHTDVHIVKGIVDSPSKINLHGKYPKDCNIDQFPPDYSLFLEGKYKNQYAIYETFYGYTTRGCPNKCSWCGVHKIEPEFIDYIDIKNSIKTLREKYGDKPILKLMDNNVLASKKLEWIVRDLFDLGYGKNQKTKTVDFNQGIDATYLTEDKMKLLSQINIKPMRIAFDRISDKKDYISSLQLASKYGVRTFSNYMLYNCNDSPKDLYERILVNIELNSEWKRNKIKSNIYSYPMKFAPIFPLNGKNINHQKNYAPQLVIKNKQNLVENIQWNKKFIRNIDVMKGVSYGSIPPISSLAKKIVGENYTEFILNLFMPEKFLRYRSKYENEIKEYKKFILENIRNPSDDFLDFYKIISEDKNDNILKYLPVCKSEKHKKWLKCHLRNEKDKNKIKLY